jgi:hypothetical protein
MKRYFRLTYFFIPVFIILFVFSTSAIAGEEESSATIGQEDEFIEEVGEDLLEPPAENAREGAYEFGDTSWVKVWVPAAAFQQRGAISKGFYDNGWTYRTGGDTDFWAPVNLPNGVDIWRVRTYIYDFNAGYIRHWLTRYYGTNSYQDIFGQSSAGTPGYTSLAFDPAHIISNNTNIYNIILRISAASSTLRFKGTRISYRRTQTAAGGQIFWDVPLGQWYTQGVHNLARAGITTGCGGGAFCPNSFVDRKQMATFLSRALGLHYGSSSPD